MNQTVRFDCDQGRKHKEKKILDPFKHRNASSKRINCPTHINIRSPKSIAPHWRITTVVENHNHELHSDAIRFGRDLLKLSPEVVAKIQFYVKADIGLRKVLLLLKEEWPDTHFVPRHVSNAILKAKREGRSVNVLQAVQLLGLLHDKEREDHRWFVRRDVDEISGRLQRVFWMDPTQRILYLRYRDVVLNDSAAQTNRFSMTLNSFVVVNNDGRSRALVCGRERTTTSGSSSNCWKPVKGLAPRIIVVDEDPEVEAACMSQMLDTAIINFIHHQELGQ